MKTLVKRLNIYESPNLVNSQDPSSFKINRRGPGRQTPLMFSVLSGNIEAVKILLEHGANTELGEQDGYTPMHGAGFQGRAEIAAILLDHGVPASSKHKDGFTPLHRACWGKEDRHADTVRVLLENGVSANEKSNAGTMCRDVTTNAATIAVLDEFVLRRKKRDEKADL